MNPSEAAAMLGRMGGKSNSPAKQAASRANGKLGGRKKSAKRTAPDSQNENQVPACSAPGAPPILFVPREEL